MKGNSSVEFVTGDGAVQVQNHGCRTRRPTRRISSCMRCFFVSRVDPSRFNFRVQRSLYNTSKLGFRCNVPGSTGGSIFTCEKLKMFWCSMDRILMLCLVFTVKRQERLGRKGLEVGPLN